MSLAMRSPDQALNQSTDRVQYGEAATGAGLNEVTAKYADRGQTEPSAAG
jgi:hypothetical protein